MYMYMCSSSFYMYMYKHVAFFYWSVARAYIFYIPHPLID